MADIHEIDEATAEEENTRLRAIENAAKDVDYFYVIGDPEPFADALVALHAALDSPTTAITDQRKEPRTSGTGQSQTVDLVVDPPRTPEAP